MPRLAYSLAHSITQRISTGLVLAGLFVSSHGFASPDHHLAASQRAVTQAILGWAEAWQDRNPDAYLASYKHDYRGKYDKRTNWLNARKNSLRASQWIRLEINQLNIRFVNPKHAIAEFIQHYESNRFQSNILKRMSLRLQNDAWRIDTETVLPSKPN